MPATKEVPRPLTAKHREDFAYPTVKDRLPVILTKVVDYVYRLRPEISESHGETGLEDLKVINGSLSRLKNELQTDKPITDLSDNWKDVQLWNDYLKKEKDQLQEGEPEPSWFTSPWLYTECYFYRRIFSAVQHSAILRDLDPFGSQKQQAFTSSLGPMAILAAHLLNTIDAAKSNEIEDFHEEFQNFFQVSLWGNKCDLSISGGADNSQKDDSLSQLSVLKSSLLVDDTLKVWQRLKEIRDSSVDNLNQLDIVLDNAGFELFTDFCLAEFLISTGFTKKIIFHPKSFPWFVSDVTQTDLDWTLDQLVAAKDEPLVRLGKLWKGRFTDNSFSVFHHNFWTLPYDYTEMQAQAPDLYAELGKSNLILFKGDLNYRKLTRDRKWNPTTTFESALGNFRPSSLCALRTLKCDLVVGLKPGQAEETQRKSEKWMLTGDFGVIQFLDG